MQPDELTALIKEVEQERRAVAQVMDDDTSLSAKDLERFGRRYEALRQMWGTALHLRTQLEKLEDGKGEAEERLSKLGYSKCDAFAAACNAAAE